MNLQSLPRRHGMRPLTTGLEIPHDQLDQPGPPWVRDELISHGRGLRGVVVGTSLVSEPGSVGFRLPGATAPRHAFLMFDEFAHVHRSGFLHLAIPEPLIPELVRLGWAEPHPITKRPDFPNSIVMLYAPRDEDELGLARLLLDESFRQASTTTTPEETRR